MSGKRKKDYVAVFAAVLELLSQDGKQPKVMEFMMDFEAAMWQVNSITNPIPLQFQSNKLFLYRHARKFSLRSSQWAAPSI
jgi:hypothetical protein